MRYCWLIFWLVLASIFIIFFITLAFPPAIFIEFLIGFIAGALGILRGFGIQGLIDDDKDNKMANDFLNLIRNELEEIRNKTADSNNIGLLYTDAWDSAVSSGIIRLLNAKQVLELSKIYKSIRDYTLQAKIFLKKLERSDSFENKKNESQLLETQVEITKANNKLHNKVNAILKEPWWKTE